MDPQAEDPVRDRREAAHRLAEGAAYQDWAADQSVAVLAVEARMGRKVEAAAEGEERTVLRGAHGPHLAVGRMTPRDPQAEDKGRGAVAAVPDLEGGLVRS